MLGDGELKGSSLQYNSKMNSLSNQGVSPRNIKKVKNFTQLNKTSLTTAINRLHPHYDLWDVPRQLEKVEQELAQTDQEPLKTK